MRYLKIVGVLAATLLAACGSPEDRDLTRLAAERPGAIRLACVGSSTTEGAGTTGNNAYPAQLQRMLGDGWIVGNFGKGGCTLTNKGDSPYQAAAKFKEALAFKPNVVVIYLGGNDTKPQNWKNKGDFVGDYKDLVAKFAALETHPRILLARPAPVVGSGNFGINEPSMLEELPLIDEAARELGLEEIDLHTALTGHGDLYPDHVHANNEGAQIVAATVYAKLVGKAYEGPPTVAGPAKK